MTMKTEVLGFLLGDLQSQNMNQSSMSKTSSNCPVQPRGYGDPNVKHLQPYSDRSTPWKMMTFLEDDELSVPFVGSDSENYSRFLVANSTSEGFAGVHCIFVGFL